MNSQTKKKIIILTLIFFSTNCLLFDKTFAYVMSSANYRMQKDSINVGGIDEQSSTNYKMKETIGEIGTNRSTSASYILEAGYQQATIAVEPTFTFTISSATCALGTLSTAAVNSCTYNVTTTTNAEDGYATTILDDGNLRDGTNDINDVADGAVTAGVEEYGIGLTGTDRAFADERAITTTAMTIASDTTGPINAQAVAVAHKASITSQTVAGTYSHTVTLVSTGTF